MQTTNKAIDVFPDVIRIKIQDDAGQPVPCIAARIKLFAKVKSSYEFLLPLSDENGVIQISREWLCSLMEAQKKRFLMSYQSAKLEDNFPKLEIRVLDERSIKIETKRMNVFKTVSGIRQAEIDAMAKLNNDKYVPAMRQVDLHGDKQVEVELSLKKKPDPMPS